MLDIEAQAFVREQIIPRWPRWKRSGVGVSDFIRQLKKIDTTTAEEAIIRTKENSKTYTWPVLSEFRQYIAEVIRENHTPSQNTEPKWVECYALETDTGKSIELCVPAGLSEEGMKAEFARHLERYDLNPTDFTLYIGQENFDKFCKVFHKPLNQGENSTNSDDCREKAGMAKDIRRDTILERIYRFNAPHTKTAYRRMERPLPRGHR
jgi:hypothetical protein